MIIVVRIAGQIGIEKSRKSALESLLLKKKYTAVLLDEKDLPRLNTVRELVAFGEIDDTTLKELLVERGKKDKKPIKDADAIIKGLKSGKKLKELGVTPYFRLHPPRGGFKKSAKLPYPEGLLGKNKDILKLVKRMF